MEYTKGEWEQDGNSIQVFQRGCICIAPKPQDGGVIERMDNLALIAAAPELYEACKDIYDFLKSHGYRTDIIKQAIAKAEGK